MVIFLCVCLSPIVKHPHNSIEQSSCSKIPKDETRRATPISVLSLPIFFLRPLVLIPTLSPNYYHHIFPQDKQPYSKKPESLTLSHPANLKPSSFYFPLIY